MSMETNNPFGTSLEQNRRAREKFALLSPEEQAAERRKQRIVLVAIALVMILGLLVLAVGVLFWGL